MKAEIIAVGTELLLGQIANTNAQFLSQRCAALGIDVYFHTVVGDNSQRLKETIRTAQKRSDIIIFTGGLGPTNDDVTKETVAQTLKKRLVYDETALERISSYYRRAKKTMTENNKKQALVIESSTVFPNDHGMAPGMAVKQDGVTYILLPGPPGELSPMFTQRVEPYLQKQASSGEKIISRVLRFFGIGESQLEFELSDLLESQKNPTIAPLAGEGEVTLRLTVKHQSETEAYALLSQLEQQIRARVGKYFYGYDDTSLPNETFLLLQKKKVTLSCAESLTGGAFASAIVQYPGSSACFQGGVICYSNEAKQQMLGIPSSLLEQDGAVSASCARKMAENVRLRFQSDVGIAFTGVAGPKSSEGKPPGTVYAAISERFTGTHVQKLRLSGTRERIRRMTVLHGCFALLHRLKKIE